MRIVFMGTPDFAVPCLARLIEDKQEIVGVFTQPDKPKGRGHQLAAPPVKELALSYGLPVFQPQKLRDGTAAELLKQLQPDLIAVVAYGRILPKEILELPKYGCINVHGSLLPNYRGAAPIQWAVLNGDTQTGVTTMYMAEGLDTGDMILKKTLEIDENETSGELFERLAPLGAQALSETIGQIIKGTVVRIPQQEHKATLAPMLSKEMAYIDWNKTAQQVHNWIRGMHPWPIAHTLLNGNVLKLHRSTVHSGNLFGTPGEVLCADDKLIVACKEGAIELCEIQAQGSRRMDAGDYLRGHPIAKGTKLGCTISKNL